MKSCSFLEELQISCFESDLQALFIFRKRFLYWKYFFKEIILGFLILHDFNLEIFVQKLLFINGGKKIDQANGANNYAHTYNHKGYFYCVSLVNKLQIIKVGEKLNSKYQNTNLFINYRYFSIWKPSLDGKFELNTQSWPKKKVLFDLSKEVLWEQLTLIDLAEIQGVYHQNVKNLQRKLIYSMKFRIIAVSKIWNNKVSKKSGASLQFWIDNICGDNMKEFEPWKLVKVLRSIICNFTKYKASSVKKLLVFRGGRKTLLRFLTIIDKALQQLVNLVLEPLVESRSDTNNYGFRHNKSAKMAVGVLWEKLKIPSKFFKFVFQVRKKTVEFYYPEEKWIYDADIDGFFENINLEFLQNYLFLPSVGLHFINCWGKSGLFMRDEFKYTKNSTARRCLISATLANFILNGLEDVIYKSLWSSAIVKAKRIFFFQEKIINPFNFDFVRYADNFIITSNNKRFLEKVVLLNINCFLLLRGLKFSIQKPTLFRLKDGIQLNFLGYVFHFKKTWKQNKIMYTACSRLGVTALYPNKRKVEGIVKIVKRILNQSLNNTSYELILRINPILHGWANYFNLGNCILYRNFIKNWVFQAMWRWASHKHKRWGKKKIVDHYFLRKEKSIAFSEKEKIRYEKEKYNKFKGRRWIFWGKAKIFSSHFDTRSQKEYNYLYNITEKGSIIPGLTFNLPLVLKAIHAYHLERFKLIEWITLVNFKALSVYSPRKLELYKKQKGFCKICQKSIKERDFIKGNAFFDFILPLNLGGDPKLISNMLLIHKVCC